MALDLVSSNSRAQAALTLHRFGFGRKSGDIDRISADPRGALIAELKAGAKPIDDPALSSSAQDARATVAFQLEKKREREERRMRASAGGAMAGSNAMTSGETNEISGRKPGPPLPQKIYLDEAQAHYQIIATGRDWSP
jgi:uncharacterized protein (DUF1800 family)